MFKKLLKYTLIGAVLSTGFSSCEKALDINDNPNSPTESTPQLVLPQAIVGTSRLVPTFSTYGGRIMYFANAGGVSGWGNGFLDYNYSYFGDSAGQAGWSFGGTQIYMISGTTYYNASKVIAALNGIGAAKIPTAINSDGTVKTWANVTL